MTRWFSNQVRPMTADKEEKGEKERDRHNILTNHQNGDVSFSEHLFLNDDLNNFDTP